MQKTFIKSFAALFLALALLLGLAQALLPTSRAYAAEAEWNNPYDGTYYNNLNENNDGTAFRSDLANLITSTHKTYTVYNGQSELALNNVWPKTDIDPNTGKMLWFYTGTPRDGFGGTSNREHVWPKNSGKAFPAESGPGSDAHHLRPTDSTLNSTRGSLQFGEVAQTASNVAKENGQITYGNYSLYGADALCYKANGYFYPAKGYRGQTARILMYMQTRWGDDNNLRFVLGIGSSKTIGDIETLFKWHLQEPPTEAEIYRNNAVADIQGNRNPFIDHPEYAAKIYCYDGESYNSALLNVLATVGDPYDNTNVEPLVGLSFNSASVTLPVGQSTTLSVVKNPVNARARMTWSSSDSTVASVTNAGVVTAKAGGTATITATDSETGISASIKITVKAVTGIVVSGAATKLQYTEGERFDPAGLVVTATYNDGTSADVPLDTCLWLDGTTNLVDLSAGTTTVLCKLGSLTQTVEGITVEEYQGGGTESITIDNFSKASYSCQNWKTANIEGIAFLYTSGGKMQFNTGKGGCYFASNKPAPGGIKSVTVVLDKSTSGSKDWELLTSDTAYTHADPYPTAGTSQGTKGVTQNGVTWILDGSAKYFTLNYKSTGVCYLSEVIIEYGTGGDTPEPEPTLTLNTTSITLAVGSSQKLTAVTTGAGTLTFTSSNTSVASVSSNGTVTAISEGTAQITASFGGKTATCSVTVTGGGTVNPDPQPTLSLNRTSLSLTVGTSQKLTATTTGSGSLSFTSSNVGVATVTQDGTVTAVAAGTATITATFGGKTAYCTVTVVGSGTVDPPEPQPEFYVFTAAVQQVLDSTAQADVRSAIKNALSEYHKLTSEQKENSVVSEKYAELQQAIEEYNASVASQNNEMQQAIKTALSGFYGTSVTVVAVTLALFVLKRRFF
ncbi:MAG: endonuclease [Corallococcus sp.]|nr:endonuclease [Corallococcus sp.]MCM1360062.1 endonuclease [Corallococcus sp.]MCM1395619.1 endonuclease [Corallococcus sp.]